MAQPLYRVVETKWTQNGREECDIGCPWEPEGKAKTRRRDMAAQAKDGCLLSLQKQPAGKLR